MKTKKKLRQKIIFICLAALILIIVIVVTLKYIENTKPENQFNFDTISPQGEFVDLQAADEESVSVE